MSHPNLRHLTARRAAAVSLTGAALLLPTAALAQSIPMLEAPAPGGDVVVCDTADDLLPVAEACEDAAEALAPVVDAATAAADQVAEPVLDAVAPVVDVVAEDAPTADDPAQAQADEPSPQAQPTAEAEQVQAGDAESTEVKASGLDAEEVAEPAAPAADGRVEQGTAITPSISGSNIPGVRSQSGVTLQPYQAPMVSTPAPAVQAPQVATTGPVSTVTPVQEAAAEIVQLTGSAVLPYTSGAGAWIAAVGLGVLGAGAVTWRRRDDELAPATIDR